ncbi:DUF4139 domain-containing protein [Paracoccus aerodenitrificans]|uniref:DUF4139 domain-containing protein n=1 Tax=Paracoccus aerodenitrificans TaxID=3017781 RepID=UPI0022EFDE8C|nr:DUF4139 domain-containing protein [Paracoccus aerodenitrificans]WBU62852.1 DUF4139 domain-containing protein [Paracoccus aerodenitrificans]
MRHLLASAALLAAAPAFAERFEVSAPVRAATLYPQGASVTREIGLDLPAGSHELIVTGLPAGTQPAGLRISAENAVIGAVNLQHDRALPDTAPEQEAVEAAQAEVHRLEFSLRQRDARVEAIRAEVTTARDVIDFLKELATSDGASSGDVSSLADTVSARILQARTDAIDAETRAQEAEQGREAEARLLEQARARLAALRQPPQPEAALVIAVEGQGAPATIRISSSEAQASWSPVYDLRLDTQAETLTLQRGVLVSQATGEDWSDVSLTLSTARPSQRATPSEISPWIVSIFDPEQSFAADLPGARMEMMQDGAAVMAEAAPAPAARTEFLGATAVYRYDSPVNLRDGVDSLRLNLDQKQLPLLDLVAEAVPSSDSTAYLVVDSENSLDEVILPGQATLYSDGAMVGQRQLDLTAAGDEMKLGFGAIDGIVLERIMPDRQGGDRGLIRRSSALTETAILSAENLTNRNYTLRMTDQVPVSEQEDLKVEWTASVDPTEVAPDGKRGVLVWEMPLVSGEKQEITLETSMRWPEGMVLIE